MRKQIRDFIAETRAGRVFAIPLRMRGAFQYFSSPLRRAFIWSFTSKELANFTYDLTETNIRYLAHVISLVTNISLTQSLSYLQEIREDAALKNFVIAQTLRSPIRNSSDLNCHFGRRIGWYAFVRALKPKVVVETGVDHGHGALALTSALLRNRAEGYEGKYFGTDLNPHAGFLFQDPYKSAGEILYGDSIESLRKLTCQVDMFVNDSDHSAEYEYREYQTIASRLSPRAVILGDNSHVSASLVTFSEEQMRKFIFFSEKPRNHWYPGAGIGISYPQGLSSS
jgi:hypothetical protein